MGLIAFIGSVVSTVVSFIGGVVSTVGPAVCGFAKNVVTAISKIGVGTMEAIVDVVHAVGGVIHEMVSLLGVRSEENPEILGAKAVQADKNIEDFDGDAEAYIRYLKEEIILDKEKFDRMKPEEKLGCEAVGITLETKALEKKLGGVEISEESLAELGKIHAAGIEINAGKLLEIIKVLKEAEITNMDDVVEFLEEKGNSDRIKTGDVLERAIGEDAEEKIEQVKEAVRSFEEN